MAYPYFPLPTSDFPLPTSDFDILSSSGTLGRATSSKGGLGPSLFVVYCHPPALPKNRL